MAEEGHGDTASAAAGGECSRAVSRMHSVYLHDTPVDLTAGLVVEAKVDAPNADGSQGVAPPLSLSLSLSLSLPDAVSSVTRSRFFAEPPKPVPEREAESGSKPTTYTTPSQEGSGAIAAEVEVKQWSDLAIEDNDDGGDVSDGGDGGGDGDGGGAGNVRVPVSDAIYRNTGQRGPSKSAKKTTKTALLSQAGAKRNATDGGITITEADISRQKTFRGVALNTKEQVCGYAVYPFESSLSLPQNTPKTNDPAPALRLAMVLVAACANRWWQRAPTVVTGCVIS